MRRLTVPTLLLASTVLTGCALLTLLMLPFKLLFSAVEAIAGGIGGLTGSSAFLQVHEGPAPLLMPLGDGRFAVENLHPDARFDVVISAPGHASRTYHWPEDLAHLDRAPTGDVEVTCVLARTREAEPADEE